MQPQLVPIYSSLSTTRRELTWARVAEEQKESKDTNLVKQLLVSSTMKGDYDKIENDTER